MSLLAPWLAFPAVLAVLCLGMGLLVERASGTRLPGQLLLPLGFTGLVALTQLTTYKEATAPATVPIALLAALAGYLLSIGRLRVLRLQSWLVGLALVTFGIFSAPAVLWGSRTFLGYGNLGDAAIHFELVDLLLSHGHTVNGLPESSFSQSAATYFNTAYPTGNHGVLATARALVGVDVAWVFQPFISFLAVLVALGLEPLARELTDDRRLSAIGAGITAHAGLVYGYAVYQEAIKELAAVAVFVLLVALVAPLLRTPPSWRVAIPLAVATGGGLGVLSLAIAPWLGPLLLAAAAVLLFRHWRTRRALVLAEMAMFAALGTLLAIPRLAQLNTFVNVNKVVLTAAEEFGNLQRRLDGILAFGVWPVPDFRSSPPPHNGLAIALVGVAVIAAVFGVAAVVRRGAWRVLLFAVISLIGYFVVARQASPWGEGKALMILSPAVALLAVAGALGLVDRRRRAEGLALLAALAIGVLWTDAYAYHGVDAAPTKRLQELERIGDRYAGKGPSFYVEFDEYAKHFLHETDPTGAVEAFRPGFPAAAPGVNVHFGFSSDIDQWDPTSVAEHFRMLVLRQGPNQSRPPLGWKRSFHGDFYDVWEREAGAPKVLGQVGLGDRFDAARKPRCRDLGKLAGVARSGGGRLAYVEREQPVVFVPTSVGAPRNWGPDGVDQALFRPVGPGRVLGEARTKTGGTFTVWFEASAQRAATVFVDGSRVGALEDQLNPRLSTTRLGQVTLEPGRHEIRIDVGGGDLEPGNGGLNRLIGPVSLTRVADAGALPVREIAPGEWRSLCGRHLDWVQAVAPA